MLLDIIMENKNEILDIFEKYGATNVKIIGSVSRREENDDSDIDFVANLNGLSDLNTYVSLKKELQSYFNRKIDLGYIEQIRDQYPFDVSNAVILER